MTWLSPPERFKRSLYKSAVRGVCRRKVEFTDQAENLCQMYVDFSYILSFSRTSMDFSASAKFDSLKLTENHC